MPPARSKATRSSGRTGATWSSKPKSEPDAALAAAIRYSKGRVRSCAQVRAHLLQRGMSARAAARAVAGCEQRGLLDDQACARLWAGEWGRRGYARAAIADRLQARGLSEAAIRRALGGTDAVPELEAAQVVVRRALRRGRAVPSRRRLAALLSRRGFDEEAIAQALAQADFNPE